MESSSSNSSCSSNDVVKWTAEEAVAGNSEALEALRELITYPLLYSRQASKLGLKWPRGLLLYGPPGTGKTSLVRAVVRECDAHLIVLSPHSVHRAHAGESEKVLRDAFAKASSHINLGKPSVIFIDEIDAICPRRDSRRQQDIRVASQLIMLMDSSATSSSGTKVVVVASTNRVDALDPALRRAGRFDAEVEVTTPSEEERLQILKLYTKKVPLDPSVNLEEIAALCNGYVGADLEALCREATMCAVKRCSNADEESSVCSLIMDDWKSARSIVGPSITRGVTVEIPKVTWDDIGGLNNLKKKLKQAVEWPLKHSDAFLRLGVSPMRGILLHGPPGCSKTTLAKAAAHAAQASFFSLSGAELFSMYVGEGEALLRNTFRRARLVAPSIIFFDEADVVAAKRGGGSSGSSIVGERLLSTLLTEMDGLEEAKVREVFGGFELGSESNDTEVLMQSLSKCCDCLSREHDGVCSKRSVPELLSTIKGPWAFIYWQESSKTIWFGRDALGRRSLLIHWPSLKDSRLIFTSVSPPSSIEECSDSGYENRQSELNFWEELPCGVYSLSMSASENLSGKVKRHSWTDPLLQELIKWERCLVEPKPEHLIQSPEVSSREQQGLLHQNVLAALKESVRRRAVFSGIHLGNAPVSVLFSGGLDSMILAALLDECLDPKYEIDLLNVSFDGQLAPDRISARAGVNELRKISCLRRWNLVEIDAELSKLTLETKQVMSLINPSNTYMDLNIGIALWLAASGDGWLSEEIDVNNNPEHQRAKYKSDSRILLVGSGADEQCAGYGRHRTKFRQSSWAGLNEEMKLDMQRIWKRNLGRDDRCIADNGKEARFPFLDEDVIRLLLDIPLWEIVDLRQPSGVGDKKILREVARMLQLHEAAVLPKRAIQFGSRIARESNRKNFGSNRAANQASAGTALFNPN